MKRPFLFYSQLKEIEEIKRKWYQRVRIDKKIYDINDTPNLKKNYKHNIEVVIEVEPFVEQNNY